MGRKCAKTSYPKSSSLGGVEENCAPILPEQISDTWPGILSGGKQELFFGGILGVSHLLRGTQFLP